MFLYITCRRWELVQLYFTGLYTATGSNSKHSCYLWMYSSVCFFYRICIETQVSRSLTRSCIRFLVSVYMSKICLCSLAGKGSSGTPIMNRNDIRASQILWQSLVASPNTQTSAVKPRKVLYNSSGPCHWPVWHPTSSATVLLSAPVKREHNGNTP